jgi:hypothetical protein
LVDRVFIWCLTNFEVAFWDSKSEVYIGEIILAMLGRMKDGSKFCHVFVWWTECEVTKFEDRDPIAWRKPIQKEFWQYPNFSHSNTVMIDHKTCRLGENQYGNLIIPTTFYVAKLQNFLKVGDDKAFLKDCLWPWLYGLYKCKDIKHFWEHYPKSVFDPSVEILNLYEIGATSITTETMEDEGTCGP